MEKIKYRAWDKKTKKMMDVKIIDFFHKKVGLGFNEYDGIMWRKFEDVILMQHTGLKDINDKEICEGDVVEFYPNGKKIEKKERGIVEYSKRRASFMFRIDKMTKVLICLNMPTSITIIDPDTNLEIIGNIYENSELRKEVL